MMNGAAHPQPRHVPLQPPPPMQPHRMNGQQQHQNAIRMPNPAMPLPFPHGRSPPNIDST